MPQWVLGPDGQPVYVDEAGNPTAVTPEVDYAGDLLDPTAPAPVTPDQLPGEAFAAAPAPTTDGGGSQPASPLPAPAASLPPQPSAIPAAQSYGVSYGQSGFDPSRNAAVRGTQGRLYQERQQIGQEVGQAETTAATAAAMVNEEQRAATSAIGNVEMERSNALALQYREQARMHSMFAAAEVAAADVAAQRTTEYRARYEQSLAQVAAMEVRPGLDVSKGQAIGLAGALFAQGFLQAQGVPVANVSGMVSQMIDRNIDLQLEKIRRGEKLAEGQRVLWDMARAEADDEATARQRLRGLMMAQAATQIEAEGAKYNSRLALAKSQAASADLKAELQKTLADITTKHFNMYMQRTNQSLDQWKAEMAVSQGWANVGINRRELELKEAAAGAKAQDLGDVVFDTTESGKGRPFARFKPNVAEKTKADIQTRAAGLAEFTEQLREYRELALDAGKIYQGWGKATLNPDFRQRVEALRTGLGAAYVKAMSGAAATDAERAALTSRIPLNRMLQKDGEEFIRLATADMQKQAIRAAGREFQAYTTLLSPEEAASLPSGTPLGTFGAGETAEASALGQRDVTPVQDRYTNAQKTFTSPTASRTGGKATQSWADFVSSAIRTGVPEQALGADTEAVQRLKGVRTDLRAGTFGMPKFAEQAEYLVKEANSSDETDAARAQRAITSLLSDPAAGYRSNYLNYLLVQNPPRSLVPDDPNTPDDESNLLREPAGTGILDFPTE
jgi:hypothetical protein